MNKSLLVEVFVPTLGPRRRDGKGEIGEVATGYPVAPDLVLTVRHVFDIDDRDRRYKPSVRVYGDRDSGWHEIIAEIPIDDGVTDAALVQVPPIFRGKTYGIVSKTLPRSNTRWEGAAFPRAGKVNDDRRAVTFSGLVFAMAPEEDQTFDVQVDAAPKTDRDWPGASGMPVFCDGKILGLGCSVPKDFRAQRLHVVPSWKLHEDPEFRKLVRPDEDEAIRAAAIGRVRTRLASDQGLLRALSHHSDAAIKQAASNQNVNAVVKTLLESDLKPALTGLHKLWKNNDDIQPSIQALAIDVAAALTSSLSVSALRADHELDGRGVIVTDLGTLTSAELAIAAWLGVDVALLPKRSDGDYPPGRYWIPLAPECGEDEGDRAIDAVCRDIECRALGDFAQALDERLTRTEDLGGFYAPTIGRPLPCLDERKNVVRERFEDEAELGERCPYLAFAMPDNPEQRQYLETVIAGIRAFYAPVLAVGLDAKREREERRALTALRLMLPPEK